MCVGALETDEQSGNLREISLLNPLNFESCPSILGVCSCVLWSKGLGWVHCVSVKVEESRECMWGRWSP